MDNQAIPQQRHIFLGRLPSEAFTVSVQSWMRRFPVNIRSLFVRLRPLVREQRFPPLFLYASAHEQQILQCRLRLLLAEACVFSCLALQKWAEQASCFFLTLAQNRQCLNQERYAWASNSVLVESWSHKTPKLENSIKLSVCWKEECHAYPLPILPQDCILHGYLLIFQSYVCVPCMSVVVLYVPSTFNLFEMQPGRVTG